MQAGDIITTAEADRIEAMENALYAALPFVEDHEGSPVYKAGAVAATLARIRAALGESKA